MVKIIEILEDIYPDVDFESCTDIIDGHILDSLSVISLVAAIEDEFDRTVPTVEIIPANFNSAKAILNMIEKLSEEG